MTNINLAAMTANAGSHVAVFARTTEAAMTIGDMIERVQPGAVSSRRFANGSERIIFKSRGTVHLVSGRNHARLRGVTLSLILLDHYELIRDDLFMVEAALWFPNGRPRIGVLTS